MTPTIGMAIISPTTPQSDPIAIKPMMAARGLMSIFPPEIVGVRKLLSRN